MRIKAAEKAVPEKTDTDIFGCQDGGFVIYLKKTP